jgi:hypothetical protein
MLRLHAIFNDPCFVFSNRGGGDGDDVYDDLHPNHDAYDVHDAYGAYGAYVGHNDALDPSHDAFCVRSVRALYLQLFLPLHFLKCTKKMQLRKKFF